MLLTVRKGYTCSLISIIFKLIIKEIIVSLIKKKRNWLTIDTMIREEESKRSPSSKITLRGDVINITFVVLRPRMYRIEYLVQARYSKTVRLTIRKCLESRFKIPRRTLYSRAVHSCVFRPRTVSSPRVDTRWKTWGGARLAFASRMGNQGRSVNLD